MHQRAAQPCRGNPTTLHSCAYSFEIGCTARDVETCPGGALLRPTLGKSSLPHAGDARLPHLPELLPSTHRRRSGLPFRGNGGCLAPVVPKRPALTRLDHPRGWPPCGSLDNRAREARLEEIRQAVADPANAAPSADSVMSGRYAHNPAFNDRELRCLQVPGLRSTLRYRRLAHFDAELRGFVVWPHYVSARPQMLSTINHRGCA